MLEADTDKKNEKINEISREMNRIKNATRMKRPKSQELRELSFRFNELNNQKPGWKKRRLEKNNFIYWRGKTAS